MDAKALSQADYLDILFDNRNKKYGSYELRKHYDNRAAKALFTVMSLCIALGAYGLLFNKESIVVTAPIIYKPVDVSPLVFEQPPKPKIEQPAPAVEAVKPTVANPVPKVVTDDKVTDPPKTVDDMKSKESGKVDAVGTNDGTIPATNNNTNTTGGGETNSETNKIHDYSEVLPAFNGDMMNYMQKNLRYPALARENGIEGRVYVQFVVNEDGSVSNAVVKRGIAGGCNEEAIRVVMSMPKWKPGMQKGHPVKVYYTLPITFMLQ